MMIKKCFLSVLTLGLARGQSLAYSPTATETEQLLHLKSQLHAMTQSDPLLHRQLYQQTRDLHQLISEPQNLSYQLEHLRDFLLESLTSRKNRAKEDSKSLKSDFIAQYQGS